jgi:hypothetical protein
MMDEIIALKMLYMFEAMVIQAACVGQKRKTVRVDLETASHLTG